MREDGSYSRITSVVQSLFKPDEPIVRRPSICPERSFYRWKKWAKEHGIVTQCLGKTYLSAVGARVKLN